MAENWYIVLELEFDPNPVEDINLINQRIDEKAKFWSSKFNDFNNGPQYRKYHQMIPKMRKMLANPDERKKQIKEACEITYGSIDKILKTIGRKGSITEDEVSRLSAKQKVRTDIIKRRANNLGIKVQSSKSIDYEEIYKKYYKLKPQNSSTYDNIKQMLKSFNVESLYEFLYFDSPMKNADSQPCEILRQRASELKKRKYFKNDSISGSGSKLCVQCEMTFANQNSKSIYDEYLKYNKRINILNEVKDIAYISGELSIEQFDMFVGKLTEIFKDRKLSEQVLTAFCKVEKIQMPVISPKDKKDRDVNIKVCRCGCINDISNGRRVCQNCGLDLVLKCPKCSAENDANVKVCKCGFEFENIDKAIALCEIAEYAIQNVDFSVAKAHLKDALSYWPQSYKVKQISNRLSELESRVGTFAEEMRKAYTNKNYFLAQRHLQNIKKFLPKYNNLEFEQNIKNAISKAKELVDNAKASNEEQIIVNNCIKAYELCNDYPGLKEIILKYPPKEPTNLEVSIDIKKKANTLRWSKSNTSGLIYYTVVKKIDAVPISINDGELIGRVSMCSITDANIMPCENYYYAVFAERAGVYSTALITKKPVVVLFEIEDLSIVAGDSLLKLSWGKIPSNASIQIYKKTESNKEVNLKSSNKESFIDREVINDKEYTYRVCLSYYINGRNQETKGVVIKAIPTKPPKAIDKLNIKQIDEDIFSISWNNPENSNIQFYYSTERPLYKMGSLIPISSVEKYMQGLIVSDINNNKGIFRHKGNGTIYIMAVTVKSGSAVVGAIKRVSKGETLTIKDVVAVNENISIYIEHPKSATGFVVLYRFDKYPTDISDIKTIRKYIPLKQYLHDGSLVINTCEQKDYYFSVFAEFTHDGTKEYSESADCLFMNTKNEVITYSISVKKRLLGKKHLILQFEAENKKFKLPDIYIMSSIGTTPMFKKSAKLFHTIPSQQVVGCLQVKIPLPKGLEKETYIKAFLKDDNLENRYQLKLKLKSNFMIN